MIIIMDCLNTRPNQSRMAKRTKRLMMAVVLSNTLCALSYLTFWIDCFNCAIQFTVFLESRNIMKTCKTNFATGPRINLPEKHGSVVDMFLNNMICFNLIIHPNIPIFENGTNSAAMLFMKINSGICREVSLTCFS